MAKHRLGLSDDDYRDHLEAWTGKRSAATLSQKERHAVLEHFRTMGFRRKPARASAGGSGQTEPRATMEIGPDDRPQVKKIKVLWIRLHRLGALRDGSLGALCQYVKRVTKIDHVDFLTPRQANVVIEGLKAWHARIETND